MPESTSKPNIDLTSTVALVTGGSNGIGAAVVTRLNGAGATVIIVDLESTEASATHLIASLPSPQNAVFMPANVADWVQLRSVFSAVRTRFGRLDFVIANAGTMEYQPVLEDSFDEQGELEEPRDAYRVIDVNLKGSLNTLKLALHHLKSTPNASPLISRSITLLASTAGYFDGAGTTAYTSSKHGVVGLLRSSQSEAAKHNIRINAIAPFFTTTHLTSGISAQWVAAGLEVNTPEAVAGVIVDVATDAGRSGEGVLVAGRYVRELEGARMGVLGGWVGEDVREFMGRAAGLFERIGGQQPQQPQQVQQKQEEEDGDREVQPAAKKQATAYIKTKKGTSVHCWIQNDQWPAALFQSNANGLKGLQRRNADELSTPATRSSSYSGQMCVLFLKAHGSFLRGHKDGILDEDEKLCQDLIAHDCATPQGTIFDKETFAYLQDRMRE
ncbi:hypothetical protein BJY00DRAFT_308114 [Aspergillus carlsbadensis]|nr:hypothetical protein BJY00DRAFT_308114 [Aspergillus carlsbadensis]